MGLFDEVICRKPLPGTPPEFVKEGHHFQTKDLECTMATYTITEDGRLAFVARKFDEDGEKTLESMTYLDHHGDINFYTCNLSGSGPLGPSTKNGEDAESVDYCARFVNGICEEIAEAARTREPAISFAKSQEEYDKRRQEVAAVTPPEPIIVIGSRLYMRYGGGLEIGKGYVEVVAYGKNNKHRQWAVRYDDGSLSIIDEFQLNRTVFASKEVADRIDAVRNRPYEKVTK